MKRFVVLLLIFALLLSGCSWMDGEYHSVKPHDSSSAPVVKSGVTVNSYLELREALVKQVNSGLTEINFDVTNLNQEMVRQYMDTAIMHVFQSCAIGAYAVEDIQYEIGNRGGRKTIAVDVKYIHNRQQIQRIKHTEKMENLLSLVDLSLNKFDDSVVIKVSEYVETDLVQYVQNYVDANPDRCMEMPQVSVSIYPERGKERVVELSFTYQTSRDALRIMQDMVSPIFSAAKLYVQDSQGTRQKYEQLHGFLMERFDYKIETSITPAYSLLRYGVGDCKTFAGVYRTMCNSAGLECQVISGTKDGEAWYWNRIKLEDGYYHVDLLSEKDKSFSPIATEDMEGYVWDYSLYP